MSKWDELSGIEKLATALALFFMPGGLIVGLFAVLLFHKSKQGEKP